MSNDLSDLLCAQVMGKHSSTTISICLGGGLAAMAERTKMHKAGVYKKQMKKGEISGETNPLAL